MISKVNFKKYLEPLQIAFKGEYTNEHLKRLYDDLKGFEERYLKAAVDELIKSRQIKFGLPTGYDLQKATYTAAEDEWKKKKRQESKEAKRFWENKKPGNKEKAREAVAGIIAFLNEPRITDVQREEYHKFMLDMAFKHECRGFKRAAAEYKQLMAKAKGTESIGVFQGMPELSSFEKQSVQQELGI